MSATSKRHRKERDEGLTNQSEVGTAKLSSKKAKPRGRKSRKTETE